jgi:hypothetical protein
LKPGEIKEFDESIDFHYHLPSGKYRVVFYYSNIPQLQWFGAHDAAEMRRVSHSTEIHMRSNEVQFEVTE